MNEFITKSIQEFDPGYDPDIDQEASFQLECAVVDNEIAHSREIYRYRTRCHEKKEFLARGAGWRPEDATGLSTCHIFSQVEDIIPAHVIFYDSGDLIEVKRTRSWARFEEEKGGTGRGQVTSFSRKSQKRLKNTLAKVNKTDQVPLFVTLTYPDHFPVSGYEWKNHIKNFWMRLQRAIPNAAMVWVLELKTRKSGENAGEIAPHFHLLVFNVPNAIKFRRWVAWNWYEVVKSGDEKHLRAGTSVELTRSWRKISGYVSKATKYLSKAEFEDLPEEWHVGRFWGVYGRSSVPWAHKWICKLTENEAVRLMRYLRRFAGIKGRDYQSLSVIADSNAWSDRIEYLLYPE